ncbi:MAG: YitT family protein [Deltaproteobacteria bacterium]|nr:YitT family protein [Deltaproteobacteria bacterium]
MKAPKLWTWMRGTVLRKDIWIPAFSIILGALLWSVSINGILVHHGLISGGFSGLALVIYYLAPKLSIGLMVLLINIPIFIMGWRMLSGKFLVFSLLGMVSLSFFLTVTTPLSIPVENPLLACLYAGVISGIGSGLIFRAGGSGGGTGIIAMVLNRKFAVRVGLVTFLLNSIPLVLGALLIDLNAALYSIVYVYASGSVMDRIISSFSERRSVWVISSRSAEISRQILLKLHRGATLLSGKGAYSASPVEVIYSVISPFELAKLKDLVLGIDPQAFLIVHEAQEVIGKGFDQPG